MATAEIDCLADKLAKTSTSEGGVILSFAGDGLKLDGEEDGRVPLHVYPVIVFDSSRLLQSPLGLL